MSSTSSTPGLGTKVPPQPSRSTSPQTTGWVGWIIFAAVMMMMIGGLHVIEGLVAIFKDTYYLVADSGLVVSVDYTAWGWVHLILGIVVAGAGFALLSGRMWARVIAVTVAAVSLIANFVFIASYPVWSTTIIAFDVLVIYALTVHGREMTDSA
jgi:hypothetical protein